MGRKRIDSDRLIAQAQEVRRIVAAGSYEVEGVTVDLAPALGTALNGVRLITPRQWHRLIDQARERCTGPVAAVSLTDETTVQALERLTATGHSQVAALNFASARRPGGGWDGGSPAQEESLARASALVATLEEAPGYYAANRACEHLFYTDHAIWSPSVPFFMHNDGSLLPNPHVAGIITMPAPNVGAMQLTEEDLLELPAVWRRRITAVLALAIMQDVRHLVLGAWGCGAFRNEPSEVALCFREVLTEGPWLRGFASVTFAIFEGSREPRCLTAFREALSEMAS